MYAKSTRIVQSVSSHHITSHYDFTLDENARKEIRPTQGAETSCVCVCTKRVCVSNTKPKACTVGIYST